MIGIDTSLANFQPKDILMIFLTAIASEFWSLRGHFSKNSEIATVDDYHE